MTDALVRCASTKSLEWHYRGDRSGDLLSNYLCFESCC